MNIKCVICNRPKVKKGDKYICKYCKGNDNLKDIYEESFFEIKDYKKEINND
jgi:hypothetical protein